MEPITGIGKRLARSGRRAPFFFVCFFGERPRNGCSSHGFLFGRVDHARPCRGFDPVPREGTAHSLRKGAFLCRVCFETIAVQPGEGIVARTFRARSLERRGRMPCRRRLCFGREAGDARRCGGGGGWRHGRGRGPRPRPEEASVQPTGESDALPRADDPRARWLHGRVGACRARPKRAAARRS